MGAEGWAGDAQGSSRGGPPLRADSTAGGAGCGAGGNAPAVVVLAMDTTQITATPIGDGGGADDRVAEVPGDARATPAGKRKRDGAGLGSGGQERKRKRGVPKEGRDGGEGEQGQVQGKGQGGAELFGKFGVLGKRKGGEMPNEPAGKLLKAGIIAVEPGSDQWKTLGAVGRKEGVRAVGEIVAPGARGGAGAGVGVEGSAADATGVDAACCSGGCGVAGGTAAADDLRETMERLLDLAHVEEGAFRHVVCFL